MNIFNKQFEEISFEDIEGLVSNKIRENEVLDYKEKFASDATTKLISALANTYGGLIIYGVRCNKDTNEPESILKLKDRKLDDTIDSICFDNIVPPVFCECKYLYNGKKTKRVFLVKVPESDLTPHAIENNTTVYVKVRGQKRAFEKADLDRQEWLKLKRQKSVDHRESLIRKARQRREQIFGFGKNEIAFEMFYIPRFPRAALLKLEALVPFLRQNSNGFAEPNSDFHLNLNSYYTVNYGVSWSAMSDFSNYYSEINVFGLYYSLCSFPKGVDSENNKNVINLPNVAKSLIQQSYLAYELLEKLNFRGSLYIGFNFFNLKGTKLKYELNDSTHLYQLSMGICKFDDSVEYSQILETTNVRDSIGQVLSDFFKHFVHVYSGQDLDPLIMGNNIYKLTYDKIVAKVL